MRSTLLKTLALGLGLLTLSIHAASPELGTATSANDAEHPLTYTAGPYLSPNSLGRFSNGCTKGDVYFATCDVYRLTVSLPADYAQTNPYDQLVVRIEWPTAAADFDLYLFNGEGYVEGTTVPPAAKSAQTATNFEQVEIPAGAGTRTFAIQVNTTLPAGQSFTGKIWIEPPTNPAPPGGGNASGIAPRFQGYIPTDASGAPSSSLGLFAGEPTMGINPHTGSLFYSALLETLRIRFDDATSPAKATWEAKDSPVGISNKVTVDPILTSDLTTGRIWAMQLSGGQSVTDYSDDDGETWRPTISGGFASGADHQGMGAGPYPAGSPILHPLFPNAVYYCSQSVAVAFCSRSDDGGLTFGPSVPIYDLVLSGCVGLHGHPKVAPDGTVYVPNKGCKVDVPLLGTGKINVVVSEDAGITWTIRTVPDSVGGLLDKGDPSVAIGKDGAVYLGYTNLANDHLRVAVSRDKGMTWGPSVDVGALAGVTHGIFPAAVAGDAGRAAVAFFGTTYTGPEDAKKMEFPGVWHLYVATTYDGGVTWFVTNTTPDDPIQGFGGIGNGGDNRNHYDFIDADIDTQGRIVVANSIGCTASCPRNGGPNTFAKLSGIVRQSGGRRMVAQFDPVEPARPAAPLLNGYRTDQFTVLSWPEPDHSGSPITGYNVYRRVNGAAETQVASATTGRQWFDYTAVGNSYQYRITAVSLQGEGPSSNAFAPTVGQNAPRPELSCTLPGQVYPDRIGEGAAYPANDIASVSVAEPQDMPGMLVFGIQNASPLAGESGASTFIYFDPASSGLRYRLNLDSNEIATFQDGQFVDGGGTTGADQLMAWTPVGTLEAGSGPQPDGSFRFIVDKAKLNISSGDVLLGVSAREDVVLSPSGVLAADYAGGRQDYTVVGNDYCLNTAPVASLMVDRTSGSAHLQVSFSGASSSDADTGDGIASYTFDFGDGSPAVTQAGSTISHVYAEAGTYTATLTVADSRQKASAAPASVAIQVLEPVQAPDPFTFNERTNVPANTFITSEALTLSGFTGSLPISVDNGLQYSVDGGAFTNDAGSIGVGQTLVVRQISASTDNTAKESTVTVGGYSTVFRTVTGTFDRVPDPFDFGLKRNTAPNTLVASDLRTLTGYDQTGIVAGPGAEYSVNGGAFTSANGTLTQGATLRVRHLTQPNNKGYTTSYVTVGGVAGYFTTKNK